MRIVAGKFKGRRLAGPEGPGLRPTSDSLRETLFNILGSSTAGVRVLDGYAGTGALGLEALSRGASHAVFIESDRRALKVLRENIRRCGAESGCTIIARDFFSAMEDRWPEIENAGLILLDPPYDVEDLAAVVRASAGVLAPGGRIMLEHSRRRVPPDTVEPVHLHRTRLVTAGDSALSFYQ